MNNPEVIAFFVRGTPVPAGSKRAFPIYRKGDFARRIVVVDTSGKRGKLWRKTIQATCLQKYTGKPLDCPIALRLSFSVKRPASHYLRSGNLDPKAPIYPVYKPDVLKLARAVEDALTGFVYVDDAQIVSESIKKTYGDIPGVLITVMPM